MLNQQSAKLHMDAQCDTIHLHRHQTVPATHPGSPVEPNATKRPTDARVEPRHIRRSILHMATHSTVKVRYTCHAHAHMNPPRGIRAQYGEGGGGALQLRIAQIASGLWWSGAFCWHLSRSTRGTGGRVRTARPPRGRRARQARQVKPATSRRGCRRRHSGGHPGRYPRPPQCCPAVSTRPLQLGNSSAPARMRRSQGLILYRGRPRLPSFSGASAPAGCRPRWPERS